jgi:hypothetical protein
MSKKLNIKHLGMEGVLGFLTTINSLQHHGS